jgi:hypothetical protein
MATQFATEMAATVIGTAIGTLIFNATTSNREPPIPPTIPTAEAEEIIPPVVEASLIPPNCTESESSNTSIKISQFLQRDTPDSEFYLNITRIDSHALLDKSNIDFDVDFDTIIKYFADEDLCPLRTAKLIEIICYFIDGYDQDVISESNRTKMRPHIPKVINIFKKYKNELNIAFICFRFIRFQCRTSDDDRKLFISLIQPDNELLTKMMPQNMRGQNLIDIIEYHLEDAIIIEEGLHAIVNIAIDKTLLSNFYLYIDKLINILKKYISNDKIVEGISSALLRISFGPKNIIKLGKYIPAILAIISYDNSDIVDNSIEILIQLSKDKKNRKDISLCILDMSTEISNKWSHNNRILDIITHLTLTCSEEFIYGENYVKFVKKIFELNIMLIDNDSSYQIIERQTIILQEKKLAEKEKELEAVANQPSNAIMATMQIENDELKEEVKKLKEYIRNSNI